MHFLYAEVFIKEGILSMELRVLQYFLAVAREQSIVRAAESLHLSQPTLSTQIKAMEKELGKQLLIRGTKGSRKVTLTEEGMILRKRAEEILNLVQKTEREISLSDQVIVGDVYIGTGETDAVRFIAKAAKELYETYPGIHYHIASGNAEFVLDQLEKGLIDFRNYIWFCGPYKIQFDSLALQRNLGCTDAEGFSPGRKKRNSPGRFMGQATDYFKTICGRIVFKTRAVGIGNCCNL